MYGYLLAFSDIDPAPFEDRVFEMMKAPNWPHFKHPAWLVIGKTADERYLPALLEDLKELDYHAFDSAVLVLERYGKKAEPARPILVRINENKTGERSSFQTHSSFALWRITRNERYLRELIGDLGSPEEHVE